MYEHIVAIVGAPRSGTSWLGQLIDSCPHVAYRFQPFFAHAFKDRVHVDSSREDFLAFFKDLYESKDPFLLQTDKREARLYPTFTKHQPESTLAFKTCRYQYLLPALVHLFQNLKLVAIVRHPCAVLNSWRKTPTEFPDGADFEKEWRTGACKNQGRSEEFFGLNKWRELAWLYLDLEAAHPERVRVVSYEELVDDTEIGVHRLFRFLNLQYTQDTEMFVKQCHAEHRDSPFAVFKSKDVRDAWQDEMPVDIQRAVYRELSGTRLERFLC